MRQVAVIAVAVAVIAAVILLIGGVVAGSDIPGTLEFFGVTVRTTGAQIFLTGAICTWALLAAAWLLAMGIRRSRQRGAELALLRGRTPRGARGAGSAKQVGVPDRAELAERAIGLPDRGESAGSSSGLPVRGEPVRGELAGLFGFAAHPGRIVTDRSGAGGGGDHADPGQNPAEQPPWRQ